MENSKRIHLLSNTEAEELYGEHRNVWAFLQKSRCHFNRLFESSAIGL